ncbi:NAD(P)/FAD-dependent oxidoreductase [Flagellimonas allohymeniacidonis]|uniref:FAD-dependent oxidoreductase n=1 Tax=Flagellimonas allohymeniacidonis TaxID=2517819 RepID=A0A4Q8QJH8_9FLAO|nr:FAD-dependent oxidoreductase [Allomuricauda hymeniacidonis]TAI48639.1 FAD-dependent oxidoreductase [Allomuricauda hymeniacidonis]
MSKKVIVVGGGIVGLSSAYFLAQEGHEVIVIDKSNLDSGASYINAGYITPSHIVSLAAPGMITKGLRYMFDSSSPFYMKPRWDLDFFKWAWSFKKSATSRKVARAMPIIRDLNLLGRELYDSFKTLDTFEDFHLENKGLLMIYKTEKERDHEAKTASRAEELDLEVTHLNRQELQKLEPNVQINASGAFYYLCDRHMTPSTFMQALQNYLLGKGVKIIGNEEVQDFHLEGDTIKSIQTDKQVYDLEELVLASGSWTSRLAKKLNVRIPLQAGKGYGINVTTDTGISMPALLLEAKIAVTPMRGFTRFAGTMEFSGINDTIRKERIEAIASSAGDYYEGLQINDKDKRMAGFGLRPVTPDGLPYIGRASKFKNLTIATGHAMMGWSTGPATGKLVSELISDKKISMDIEPFYPERSF